MSEREDLVRRVTELDAENFRLHAALSLLQPDLVALIDQLRSPRYGAEEASDLRVLEVLPDWLPVEDVGRRLGIPIADLVPIEAPARRTPRFTSRGPSPDPTGDNKLLDRLTERTAENDRLRQQYAKTVADRQKLRQRILGHSPARLEDDVIGQVAEMTKDFGSNGRLPVFEED
jgi:hypothetical protein